MKVAHIFLGISNAILFIIALSFLRNGPSTREAHRVEIIVLSITMLVAIVSAVMIAITYQ